MVIMGSRDLQKGINAASLISKNIVVRELNVNDEVSILALCKSIETEFGHLDVLINNAGIGELNKEETGTGPGRAARFVKKNFFGLWKLVRVTFPVLRKIGSHSLRRGAKNVPLHEVKIIMETNVFGPWRMIQAFLPLLMKGDHARIINVSSGMGELKSLSGFYPGYSMSKAALNALTIMFSNELKPEGIRVNAICPGWVKTDMGGPDAPRTVGQGADTAVWLATEPEIPTGKFFRDRREIDW
jgi:NAD(P)-dependent dehydrogenase (short-subunit alcohol dehydrogenase family)